MIPSNSLQRDLRRLATAPRAGYRRALRQSLRRRASELGMHTAPAFFPMVAWATRIGAAAFGVVLVVSGAIAYESPNVTRDSSLYFIKQVGESIEVAIARSPERIVDLRLRLAARRLAEASVLAKRGVIDIPTITEVTTNTQQAASAARTVAASGRKQAEAKLVSAAEDHIGALTTVSVTAQVAANKSVVNVKDDVLSFAPTTDAIHPQETPSTDTLEVPLSNPGDGSVAGDPLAVRPSPPTNLVTPPASSISDPSIQAVNEAITASEDLVAAVNEEVKAAAEASAAEAKSNDAPVDAPPATDVPTPASTAPATATPTSPQEAPVSGL